MACPEPGAGMKRRVTTSGKATKTRPAQSYESKAASAPAVARHSRSSDSDLREQLDQSRRELKEALEQQAATSEVLKVISGSPGELKIVFTTMLKSATRLCDAKFGMLYRCEGDRFRLEASHNAPFALVEHQSKRGSFQPLPGAPLDCLLRTRKVVRGDDPAIDPAASPSVILGGARSTIAVPMFKDTELVGAIFIYRQEQRPFTDKQIELVQNFAAQAVIAIENARLFNETKEALEQQTATAEVLKVISRSSVDLETVLDTLVQTVARLCRADQVYMFHLRHDLWHLIANCGLSAEASKFFETHPFTPGRGSTSGRAALERRAVLIPDVLQDPEYTLSEGQEIAGYRTTLGIPLLREDTLIGVYSITRTRVEPFTDKEIELATSFADQAVIAIENARLLNELRQRTDDLSESLEQQTATSEVLKVISSSPGDLEPVFYAMLENASRICERKIRHSLSSVRATRSALLRCMTRRRHLPSTQRQPCCWPPPESHLVASRPPSSRSHRRHQSDGVL